MKILKVLGGIVAAIALIVVSIFAYWNFNIIYLQHTHYDLTRIAGESRARNFVIDCNNYRLAGRERLGVGSTKNEVERAISRRQRLASGTDFTLDSFSGETYTGSTILVELHRRGVPYVQFSFCENGYVTRIRAAQNW